MKETRFIAQNKEKWEESEKLLSEQAKDPEKLSNLFIQVVDDLSFSRTHYPNRSVRAYLNQIAREYFSIIYSHHKEKKNRFKTFWLDELPQIVLHCKKELLISLLIFLFSAAAGVFSAANDPQFTSSILGDRYVSMTKENISKGDPMAVYKKGHQVDMFLGIAFNNLFVAFRTYVFGLFFSVGTLVILIYNGVMIGCFQYFFVERGLLAESALTIWLHGTLEISSIIIAGGAGLTLGSGLIFPGTYSRLQAFQISAIRSLKLMIGITPIFIFAAVIESFLTRYTETPDILRGLLIALSAIFIIGYFVVYPRIKSRSGFEFPLEAVRLQPSRQEPVQYARIKNNGEIIKDAFLFYRRNTGKIIPWIAGITLLMALGDYFFREEDFRMLTQNAVMLFVSNLYYGLDTPTPFHILFNSIGVSVLLSRIFHLAEIEMGNKKNTLLAFLQTFIIVAASFGLIFWLGAWGVVLLALSFVLVLIFCYTQSHERTNILTAWGRTRRISFSHFSQVAELQIVMLALSLSFLMILLAPLLFMYTDALSWSFSETDTWSKSILNFIEIYIKFLGFNLILPFFAATCMYLYFTLSEIASAESLKKSIAQIGIKIPKSHVR